MLEPSVLTLFQRRHNLGAVFARCADVMRAQDTEEGGWERVVGGGNGSLSVQRKFIGRNSGGR